MPSEKVLCLLVRQLSFIASEIADDAQTGVHFGSRLAQLDLAKKIISDSSLILDQCSTKLAREYAQTTGRRVVWQLWPRLKSL